MHYTGGGIGYDEIFNKEMKMSEYRCWQTALGIFLTPEKKKDKVLEDEYEEVRAELKKNQPPPRS